MKKLSLILLPVIFFACASKKGISTDFNNTPVVESNCPPEGTCTITFQKDKSLSVKGDDFNRPYYELLDAPGKIVVTYAYNKTKNPDYQDDFYSEEVVFETDENFSDITTGVAPQMYFTVKCFCRGKAGTYKADGGKITVEDNKLLITLPKIIDNQLTTNIVVLFK